MNIKWKKYYEELEEFWIVDEKDTTKNKQLSKIKEIYKSFDHDEELLDFHKMLFPKTKVGLVFDGTSTVRDENKITILERDEKRDVINYEKGINHHLIIGDNLHALQNLQLTHNKSVNIIYIDPPYNTGGSNLGYRDKFGRNAWLNFMKERLILAQELLSDDGVIFISIDDNEQAYLKVLMDEIFGEDNFISNLNCLDNLKGKENDKFISETSHYILCYRKSESIQTFNKVPKIDEEFTKKYNKADEYGVYTTNSFKKTGASSLREDRPKMWYPILIKDNNIFSITLSEYKRLFNEEEKLFNDDFLNELKKKYQNKGYNVITPLKGDGTKLRWTSNFSTFNDLLQKNELLFSGKNSINQKKRPTDIEEIHQSVYGTPKNFFYSKEFTNGKKSLEKIKLSKYFTNPKTPELLKYLITLIPNNEDSVILDFFAGSGTTAEAIMLLNKEDNGKRQFIGVQWEEKRDGSQSFEDGTLINSVDQITIERIRRIIQGTDSLGIKIDKFNPFPENNLIVHKIVEKDISISGTDKTVINDLTIGEKMESYKLLNNSLNNINIGKIYKLIKLKEVNDETNK